MHIWQGCIIINPNICHAKLCIKGMRIMVSVVLDNLAEGMMLEEIVDEYPPLTPDDVRAAIAYAAALVGQESARCPRSVAFSGL